MFIWIIALTKSLGKELSDKEVIQAMVENPKLIERPIVVKQKKAVLQLMQKY